MLSSSHRYAISASANSPNLPNLSHTLSAKLSGRLGGEELHSSSNHYKASSINTPSKGLWLLVFDLFQEALLHQRPNLHYQESGGGGRSPQS